MTPEELFFDEVISDALNVLRFSANEKAEALKRLSSMEKELIAKLSEEDLSSLNSRAIAKILASSDEIIANKYKEVFEGVDLFNIASVSSSNSATMLNVVLGIEDAKSAPLNYLRSVASAVLIQGAPSKDWWQAQADDLKLKFASQVRQGAINGETNQQIISRIVGKNGQPGVMPVARRNAASLVQTSIQTIANDARRRTFKSNSALIKGLKQVSTLDSHTTIVCVSYSGAEWNLNYEPINGYDLPFNGGAPRHWNCRSVEIPLTKTYRELGVDIDEPNGTTRASSDGQISANTTFEGFLKRKGKAYQDEVLGPGRAQLWRDGKITLRDLVNSEGNPISLEELRKIATKNQLKIETFDVAQLEGLSKYSEQPVSSEEELYEKAQQGLTEFQDIMNKVGTQLNLRTDLKPNELTASIVDGEEGFLFLAPLKGRERAREKVESDYGGDWSQLRDVIRGTISVNTPDDLQFAIQQLDRFGFKLAMQPKDRFANPTSSGYRDVLSIMELPSGMLAEVQFHLKDMTAAKNDAHSLYEIERSLDAVYGQVPFSDWKKEDRDEYNNVVEQQRRIYGDAWRRIIRKIN